MTPTPERAAEIASFVLAKAAVLDHRTPQPDELVVEAWAESFVGQPVWMAEALRAVTEHYRQPDPSRLMPGDVLARTRAMQPGPDSSDERLHDFVDTLIRHPFSPLVQQVGVPVHTFGGDDEAEQVRAWITEHRTDLVESIRGGDVDARMIER